MADCFPCPSDHYPNKDQTSCIPKVVVFLSYEEPLGIGLAICALSCSLVTVLVLILFMKHHNSPIVKVNNRSLTYTLLISLFLCFLCPLLHIGRPEKVVCIFRQFVFGFTFIVTISSVLAKTCTVLLAFTATRPGSTMKIWVGKRLAISIILPCVMVEAGFSTARLATSPAFPNADRYSRTEEIMLECAESSSTLLFSRLFFFSLLSIVSITVAFFAHRLPDAFNESKCITFSMFIFCCVWLAYIATYFTTRGRKLMVVEIFSNMSSTAALLVFMFFPKCFIIMWRPELNSREQLRKFKC